MIDQERTKNSDIELAVDIGTKIAKETARSVADTESLVKRVKEAREALDELTATWKVSWLDWLKDSKSMLEEMRMWRMGITSEAKNSIKEMGELRQFFLTDQHVEEIKRLKEFVDVCERLQKLKDAGTLDAISEIMLKL